MTRPDEYSLEMGETGFGDWKKEGTCFVVVDSILMLSPAVTQEVENTPDELGGPIKEVSRQTVEDDFYSKSVCVCVFEQRPFLKYLVNLSL